jgi:hypothetical protein
LNSNGVSVDPPPRGKSTSSETSDDLYGIEVGAEAAAAAAGAGAEEEEDLDFLAAGREASSAERFLPLVGGGAMLAGEGRKGKRKGGGRVRGESKS